MVRKFRLYLFLLALLIVLIPSGAVFADSGQEVLKVGSRGEQVSQLQSMLKEKGFFPAGQKVTGYFGWITYNSVIALEKKFGLAVNGRVGAREWSILNDKKPARVVLGYYTVDYPGDRLSRDSLVKNSQLINHSAMFDFAVDEKGNLKGTVSSEGIKLARSKGIKTLMVIHNISGSIDSHSAYNAISDKYRKKLIDNIVNEIKKNGYDGVNIDFEGIPVAGKKAFNSFLEELDSRLGQSKLLTVAVPAKTSDNGNSWNGAYDFKTIGRLADYVVLMTYDEHWGEGPPGPVASVPWLTRVLDYSTGVIPPHKILMGIPAYGYDWPSGQKGKAVKWNSMSRLIEQYGNVKWDNNYSVPYLTYKKGSVQHQVWFENKYSLAIKLGLVEKYNLGGIALWRLGFEDASFWDTVKSKL